MTTLPDQLYDVLVYTDRCSQFYGLYGARYVDAFAQAVSRSATDEVAGVEVLRHGTDVAVITVIDGDPVTIGELT